MNPNPITVTGLKEFRADLRRARGVAPRELTRALKESGRPVPPRIVANAPKLTGALAAAVGNPTASGTKAKIPITARHAPIIEFAYKTPKRPKLGPSLSARYGPPPRFAYKALDSVADEVVEILTKELNDVLSAYGWFHA